MDPGQHLTSTAGAPLLPLETLQQILSYGPKYEVELSLDSSGAINPTWQPFVQFMMQFMQTCHTWRTAGTPILYANIHLDSMGKVFALGRTLETSGASSSTGVCNIPGGYGLWTKSLTYDVILPNSCKAAFAQELARLFAMCPNIRLLQHNARLESPASPKGTSRQNVREDDLQFLAPITSLSQLRCLDITLSALAAPPPQEEKLALPSLQELTIRLGYPGAVPSILSVFHTFHLPSLRSLSLFPLMVYLWTSGELRMERLLRDFAPQLESLDVGESLSTASISGILRTCPKLKRLSIRRIQGTPNADDIFDHAHLHTVVIKEVFRFDCTAVSGLIQFLRMFSRDNELPALQRIQLEHAGSSLANPAWPFELPCYCFADTDDLEDYFDDDDRHDFHAFKEVVSQLRRRGRQVVDATGKDITAEELTDAPPSYKEDDEDDDYQASSSDGSSSEYWETDVSSSPPDECDALDREAILEVLDEIAVFQDEHEYEEDVESSDD